MRLEPVRRPKALVARLKSLASVAWVARLLVVPYFAQELALILALAKTVPHQKQHLPQRELLRGAYGFPYQYRRGSPLAVMARLAPELAL
jgi:hypothetical protein